MPISSGFGYYQATPSVVKPVVQPQIVSRSAKFRINQRNKYRNGLSSTSKAVVAERVPPSRPTAVRKQPSRSDTFTLPAKRNESNGNALSIDPERNRSPRQTAREPAVKKASSFTELKPTGVMQKSSETRPVLKQANTGVQQANPVRFSKPRDSSSSSSSPVHSRKNVPIAEPPLASDSGRSRRIRIGNDEYVMQRQQHSPTHTSSERHSTSPRNKPQSQRFIHMVREPPPREAADACYVESEPRHIIYEQPRHRPAVIRKTGPPPEYFYVDEVPAPIVPAHHRYPHRSRVAYIGNDRPLHYEEETIYVDDHGNEIQYIYEAEPIYRRRHDHKTHYYPSSDVVYE